VKLKTKYLTHFVALLYALNLVDALLTILWVQTGFATEANALMDMFLSIGVVPFLLVKIGMGTFAAVVFIYGADYRLARIGVTVALYAYAFTMGVHILTGLAASGFLS
jgi:hypothetical protein